MSAPLPCWIKTIPTSAKATLNTLLVKFRTSYTVPFALLQIAVNDSAFKLRHQLARRLYLFVQIIIRYFFH